MPPSKIIQTKIRVNTTSIIMENTKKKKNSEGLIHKEKISNGTPDVRLETKI